MNQISSSSHATRWLSLFPSALSLGSIVVPFLVYCVSSDLFFYVLLPLCVWQLWVAFSAGFFSLLGLYRVSRAEKIDYRQRWKDRQVGLSPAGLEWDDVVFYYLIPAYQEELQVLEDTLQCVLRSDGVDVCRQVVIVLCMEEREEGSADLAETLISRHRHSFRDMYHTIHPSEVEGEVAGKGSNLHWASLSIQPHAEKCGVDTSAIIVVCTDCDTQIHPKYLSAVCCDFLSLDASARCRRCWGMPLMMDLNLDSLPTLTRAISLVANNSHLSYTIDGLEHVAQSSFAVSYHAAELVDFWNVNVVSEDFHFYVKLVLHFDGHFRNVILPLPARGYSLLSKTYFATIRDRFRQAMRHVQGFKESIFLLRGFCMMRQRTRSSSLPPLPRIGWLRIAGLLYSIVYRYMITIIQFLTMTCVLYPLKIAMYLPSETVARYTFGFVQPSQIFSSFAWRCFATIQFFNLLPCVMCVAAVVLYQIKNSDAILRTFHLVLYSLRTVLELIVVLPFGIVLFQIVPLLLETVRWVFDESDRPFFVSPKSVGKIKDKHS